MASPPITNPDPQKVPVSIGGGIDLGGAPPPVEKKKAPPGKKRVFDDFMNKHKPLKKYAEAIWKWSAVYGIDPVYYAALLWSESKGDPTASHRNKDGSIDSGLAQINGTAHPDVTREQAMDPAFAIKWAARFFSAKVQAAGGDYVKAYNGVGGYNPDGPNIFAGTVPKTYVTSGTGLTMTESAATSVERAAVKDAMTDPFVTGVKKGGKLALSGALVPPKNVLKFDGTPLRQSEFLRLKRSMEETYVTFTGKRPSNGQIQQLIMKGWSTYQLTNLLSQGKSFQNSPMWKSKAPMYQEAIKDMTAPGTKLDPNLIRKAIVNNWQPAVLQAEMRKSKGYIKSNEFQGIAATNMNVYQSIFGTPNPGGKSMVLEASLAGWSPDQFASWLRSREEYVYTPEYRAKAVSLVEQLGFLTGRVATLSKPVGPPPQNPNPDMGVKLPNDKRIPGTPDIAQGPALVANPR